MIGACREQCERAAGPAVSHPGSGGSGVRSAPGPGGVVVAEGGLALAVLGTPQLRRGGAVLTVPTRKGLWLLAYLAVEGPQPRSVLAELLWSDVGEEQARGNLRAELYRLRRADVGHCIRGDKHQLSVSVESDWAQYRALLAAERVAEAERCWRGEFLSGAVGGATFEDWLRVRREELSGLRAAALASAARGLEAQGALRPALDTWLGLLAQDELVEEWHREAMRLHGLLGEREAALARFSRCQDLLARELGLAPLPATVQLAERLRAGALGVAVSGLTRPGWPAERPRLEQLPLTGRGEVLKRLLQAPGLAVLTGEPGIGKTRLVDALVSGGRSVAFRGSERRLGTPLAPVVEPLRRALEGGWLRALAAPHRAEVGRLLPELGGARLEADLSPAGRVRFLEALAAATVLALGPDGVLVLEDLQWFDETSLELCALILARAGRPPGWGGRCLITARPAELADAPGPAGALRDWEGLYPTVREALAPLAEAELLELVRQLARTAEGQLFARRLHGVTGGNPLFVTETLRGLLESGEIEVTGEGWLTRYDGVTQGYSELPMPRTVRSAVLVRADRLGAEARRVLDAASLAGEVFTLRELAGATALDEWTSLAALERAGRAGLLVEDGGGYRFSHDLVRRTLVDALGPSRASLLHRRLAESLIATGGDPAAIARHLAADPPAAAPWWHRAAQEACGRYAARQAMLHLGRALDALPQGDARRLHWLLERASLAHGVGDTAVQDADLREAQTLAFSGPDRGRVALERARFLSIAGRPVEALRVAREAAALLQGGGAQERYEADQCLAEMAYYQEHFALALATSERAAQQARALGPQALMVALNWLGIVRDTALDPEGALAAYGEGLGLQRQVGDSYLAARLHNNRATVYGLYGRFDLALQDLDAALTLIRGGGYRHLEGFVLDTRVRVLRGLGQLAEARRDLDAALVIGREMGSHRLVSHCLHHRVLLLNDARAHREALDAATEALEAAGATASLTDRVLTLSGRSQARLALGDPVAALRDAAEAARLFADTGAVREALPFTIWLAHIDALRANGLASAAAPLLEVARAELHRLAASLTDPATRAAFLALPECAALLALR